MRWKEWASPELCAAMRTRQTDVYRLHTGPEGWVERLGDSALLSYLTPASMESLAAAFHRWRPQAGGDILRLYSRHVPSKTEGRTPITLVWGESSAKNPEIIQEDGLNYGVEFTSGYAYGLYPDQRENRRFLRRLAPRRMLNLFAYTCAFSVAAAHEGAVTCNVDLSKRSLERGRENFRLNGLAPAPHTFITDDVLDVLPRLRRRGLRFDAIILDPPTFARGKKNRPFRVETQMPLLIRLCLELMEPASAWLLVSTNCESVRELDLESWIRGNLPADGKLKKLHREPAAADLPEGKGPATVWARLAL